MSAFGVKDCPAAMAPDFDTDAGSEPLASLRTAIQASNPWRRPSNDAEQLGDHRENERGLKTEHPSHFRFHGKRIEVGALDRLRGDDRCRDSIPSCVR